MAKKNLKRGLALGALMAFVITGSAMAADITSSPDKSFIKVSYGFGAVPPETGKVETLTADIINITTKVEVGADETRAVWARGKNGVGNTVVLGSESSVINIKANASEGFNSYGIFAQDNGKINVNAKSLLVNVTAASPEKDCYGIIAQQRSDEATGPKDDSASINIDAKDIVINSNQIGVIAMSNGRIDINGNLEVNAPKALVARGYSIININDTGKNIVKLNGDISFDYDGGSSGTVIDSKVNVTLSGSDSIWKGNAKATWSGMSDENHSTNKDNLLKVKGLNITLQDEAKWIIASPIKDEEDVQGTDGKWSGQRFLGINNLTMNNGGTVEFVNDTEEGALEIDTLKGTGAVFNMKNGSTIKVKTLENDDVTLNAGTIKFVGGDTRITGKLTLNNGADIVESNEPGVPAMNLTLAAGSKLDIDDLNNYVEDGKPYPVIKIASGKVTAEKGASVSIGAAEEGTYTIVKAKEVDNKMSDEDVTFDGGLKTGTWINSATEMNLKVAIKNLEEETALVPTENAGLVETALKNINKLNSNPNTQQLGDFFNKISALAEQANTGSGSVTPPQVKAAIASSVQSGTNNGAASTAASVVNNVSGITNNRMSIVTPAPKGGRGVGLFAEESGAGVWVQYLHGKDKAEDLPSGSSKTQYKNSYNGILVGADFKKVDKFQSGIAFSYTDGDGSNSSTTGGTLGSTGHTDFKSYGVTYYGSIKNDTTNTMFDIGYNHSKADSDTNILLTGHTDSSTSKTNTWSAGVTVEKSYTDGSNGAQFIPYVGVRYMNISTDDFTTKMGYHNAMDDQNVFLIPVGIKFRQENVYKNGWKVTPKADLSYVWATGDTDSNVNVTIPGMPSSASTIGYTVMDDGSFLGTVGVEAEKGDWTYGLSYSYQKGEYQRSDKWFVDVRYSF